MIIFLVCVIIVLLLLLGASLYQLYKFGRLVLDVEDQVEESLDILNECYGRLSKIAKLDVMVDEPVVRDMVQTLKKSIDAILLVANKVSGPLNTEEKSGE